MTGIKESTAEELYECQPTSWMMNLEISLSMNGHPLTNGSFPTAKDNVHIKLLMLSKVYISFAQNCLDVARSYLNKITTIIHFSYSTTKVEV